MGKKIADEKEKKGGRLIMVPDEYPITNAQNPHPAVSRMTFSLPLVAVSAVSAPRRQAEK
jgi:hypothetical protein